MNKTTLAGPCAGYEFEIVELHEGVLDPDEARRVRSHVETCACCRDWQARYASLDAALARDLPQLVLSVEFSAKLRERIEGFADPTTRRALRAVVESEHDWMLRLLKRRARRLAMLSAAAAAAVAATCFALVVALGPRAIALLPDLDTGDGHALPGAIAAAAVIGALAWSAARGVLPGVPLRR